MESPSLEVFKNCGDVTPRDVVSGHGRDELGFGIPEVFSNLEHSVM